MYGISDSPTWATHYFNLQNSWTTVHPQPPQWAPGVPDSHLAHLDLRSASWSCSWEVVPWTCLRTAVLLTHPDRNTQNERRATQSNTRQRTQGKQNQRSRNNTSKPKTEHRGSRTLLETTNDRKPKPTHQPQAAPIETTTQGLPQPHRPSQPNLPRTTLDPTRHPRQHRTRTSNVQAPHGITPCGVCARYSAA